MWPLKKTFFFEKMISEEMACCCRWGEVGERMCFGCSVLGRWNTDQTPGEGMNLYIHLWTLALIIKVELENMLMLATLGRTELLYVSFLYFLTDRFFSFLWRDFCYPHFFFPRISFHLVSDFVVFVCRYMEILHGATHFTQTSFLAWERWRQKLLECLAHFSMVDQTPVAQWVII